MNRTRALFYMSFIVFVSPTVAKEIEYLSKLDQLSFGYIFLHVVGRVLLLGVGFIFICNTIVFLSHIVGSLYYYRCGYGMAPIYSIHF